MNCSKYLTYKTMVMNFHFSNDQKNQTVDQCFL